MPNSQWIIIIIMTSWQVTSKLNHAQIGMYFMYLGAVVGSTGRISFLLTASFIKRDILPADVSATPNLSLKEVLVKASPSVNLITRVRRCAALLSPNCRDAFLRLSQLPSLRDWRFYSAILLAETQECVSTSFRRTHDNTSMKIC